MILTKKKKELEKNDIQRYLYVFHPRHQRIMEKSTTWRGEWYEGKLKKMVQTCCMPPTDASLLALLIPLFPSFLPISPRKFSPVSLRNNSEFSEKDLHDSSH